MGKGYIQDVHWGLLILVQKLKQPESIQIKAHWLNYGRISTIEISLEIKNAVIVGYIVIVPAYDVRTSY